MRWSPEGYVDLGAPDLIEGAPEPTAEEIGGALVRDLRSPLVTIERYLDLLADGGVGALTPEQLEYLDVARRNVQRLSNVVSDWLDVTRVESGQVRLEQVPVDLAGIVAQVADEYLSDIEAKEQRLTVEVPTEPILALGDTRAVTRIVRNLVSNAYKYTPPRGAIHLILSTESAAWVRLDVTDTGIGLGEEDQQHLFVKFFRARLTEATPGTGLGLALTRALMELMGGQISLTSALGKGSTFSMRLPLAHEAADPAAR